MLNRPVGKGDSIRIDSRGTYDSQFDEPDEQFWGGQDKEQTPKRPAGPTWRPSDVVPATTKKTSIVNGRRPRETAGDARDDVVARLDVLARIMTRSADARATSDVLDFISHFSANPEQTTAAMRALSAHVAQISCGCFRLRHLTRDEYATLMRTYVDASGVVYFAVIGRDDKLVRAGYMHTTSPGVFMNDDRAEDLTARRPDEGVGGRQQDERGQAPPNTAGMGLPSGMAQMGLASAGGALNAFVR